jgi:hypothetical protein
MTKAKSAALWIFGMTLFIGVALVLHQADSPTETKAATTTLSSSPSAQEQIEDGNSPAQKEAYEYVHRVVAGGNIHTLSALLMDPRANLLSQGALDALERDIETAERKKPLVEGEYSRKMVLSLFVLNLASETIHNRIKAAMDKLTSGMFSKDEATRNLIVEDLQVLQEASTQELQDINDIVQLPSFQKIDESLRDRAKTMILEVLPPFPKLAK